MTIVHDPKRQLYRLADRLVSALTELEGVTEVEVEATEDSPPYRRVACGDHRLADIRIRPCVSVVRMEVTTSWRIRPNRFQVGSVSATALLVRSNVDIIDVFELVKEAVDRGPG